MRVLICGAGRVGQGIARRLSRERHDVTLVDADPALIEQVTSELDVRGLVGHAAYPEILKAAGARDCEMIIAVTHSDEINMVICKMAQTLFDVPTKVARIRSLAYLDKSWSTIFSREGLAIDVVISPEQEVGNSIVQRFETPGAIVSATFGAGTLRLLGLDVTRSSALENVVVGEFKALFPLIDARVVGIGREDRLFAPRPEDRLVAGDRAYLICRSEHSPRLIDVFSSDTDANRHVVIVGGGNIGTHLASRLEKQANVRVRLIEPDAKRAETAAAQLRRAIVIKGDGLTPDILSEAGVDNAHFAIGVTNDDKVNLLVCNIAKTMGAKRALALVNSPTLAALARDMKVDVTLDPRVLTVSKILLKLRRGRFVALQSLEDGEAEVAEGVVFDSSPLKDTTLLPETLPDGVAVGAVLRNGEPVFPDESFRARPGDHVVLFFERDRTRKVEQYFRVSPDFF